MAQQGELAQHLYTEFPHLISEDVLNAVHFFTVDSGKFPLIFVNIALYNVFLETEFTKTQMMEYLQKYLDSDRYDDGITIYVVKEIVF